MRTLLQTKQKKAIPLTIIFLVAFLYLPFSFHLVTASAADCTSITYKGVLTLKTTATNICLRDWYNIKEELECTFTIPFHITVAKMLSEELGWNEVLLGFSNESSLSYSGKWSLTAISTYERVTISPSSYSGEVSGTADAPLIFASYGDGQAVFGFLVTPSKELVQGSNWPIIGPNKFSVNRVWSNGSQYTSVYESYASHPFSDGMFALNDACGFLSATEATDLLALFKHIRDHSRIRSNHDTSDWVIPKITFDGEISDTEVSKIGYTGQVTVEIEDYESIPLASIAQMSGAVKIHTAKMENDEWADAVGATALKDGDTIEKGLNGDATIEFADGCHTTIGPMTIFRVVEEGGFTVWDLFSGKIFVDIHETLKNRLRVCTPTVIVAIRGTQFTVEVAEDNTTTVTVLRGVVEVQNRAGVGNVSVEATHRIIVPQVLGGLDEQEMSGRITAIDSESINKWWETSASDTQPSGIPSSIPYGIPSSIPSGTPSGLPSVLSSILSPFEDFIDYLVKLFLPESLINYIGVENARIIMHGIVGTVLFGVVALPISLIRHKHGGGNKAEENRREWNDVLKLRLAKGEITVGEYKELKKSLEKR